MNNYQNFKKKEQNFVKSFSTASAINYEAQHPEPTPINRVSATGPTEDSMYQGGTTPRVAPPRARATDEDQLVTLEKELLEARCTIEEKERPLKV